MLQSYIINNASTLPIVYPFFVRQSLRSRWPSSCTRQQRLHFLCAATPCDRSSPSPSRRRSSLSGPIFVLCWVRLRATGQYAEKSPSYWIYISYVAPTYILCVLSRETKVAAPWSHGSSSRSRLAIIPFWTTHSIQYC